MFVVALSIIRGPLGVPELSKSMHAIEKLAIRRYEMSHDTVRGRVLYGVLPRDTSELSEIYNQSLVRSRVDTKSLFAHGLAAVQALYATRPRIVPVEPLRHALAPISVERTVAELAPKRDLAKEKVTTLYTRLRAFAKDNQRRLALIDFEFELENATINEANRLSVERMEDQVHKRKQRLKDEMREENQTRHRIFHKRGETQREKLADELVVASAKLKLAQDTAIQVAKEAEKEKTENERRNEDIAIRLVNARGDEQRQTVLTAIKAMAGEVATAATTLRFNPERLRRLVMGLAFLICSFFVSRESAVFARRMLAAYLTRPALVRETSFGRIFRPRYASFLDGIVLPFTTRQRLDQLAASLRGARKLRAPLRHTLLYGAPGTGKTLVARRLAEISGLDWAIMSGGDAGPLGAHATTELHKLFNWANRSPRGLLLFVDEAETALADRGRPDLSEDAISALNAFLYHTSDASYNVVLVLATNRPADLDPAVLDRLDDCLEIPLPDDDGRRDLLHLNFDLCFRRRRPRVFIDDALDVATALEDLVPLTRGFSGREISKLLLSIQGAVFSTHHLGRTGLRLTPAIWKTALDWKLHEVKPRGHSS